MRFKVRAACAVVAVGALVAATPAATGAPARDVASGLNGPRGVAIGPSGELVVAESKGKISRVVRGGPNAGKTVKIGKVPENFLAPAIDINNKGQVFALTVGSGVEGSGTLYRITPGQGRERIANIRKYQRSDPDPFNLESRPTSNAYGVAALNDGSALVADAEGNDLLRVWPSGRIITVARVKPRTVASPDLGPEGPPEGTPMPAEAVITSVTVGSDGSYYIGELRGFPATPGTSQIWRIKPGSRNAVCRPSKPNKGDCKRHADGLTSVVDLAAGPGGSVYAVELSKVSWLMAESGAPGAEIGSLIRIGRDPVARRELAEGQLVLPGGVEIGRRGGAFVTTPVFGPGKVMRVQ